MNRREKSIAIWLARISGIMFAFLMFALSYSDIKVIITEYPTAIDLLVSGVVLSLTFALWNKAKYGGVIFICGSFLFFLLYKQLLIVMVIFFSIWLFLTGVLFILSQTKSRRGRRKRLIRMHLPIHHAQQKRLRRLPEPEIEIKMGTK